GPRNVRRIDGPAAVALSPDRIAQSRGAPGLLSLSKQRLLKSLARIVGLRDPHRTFFSIDFLEAKLGEFSLPHLHDFPLFRTGRIIHQNHSGRAEVWVEPR